MDNQSQSKSQLKIEEDTKVEAEAIQLDVCLIDNEITKSKSKAYTQPDFAEIRLYNPMDDLKLTPSSANPNTKYVANITSHFNYIGILSETLTREIFGKNKYSNGDLYIGLWEKNQKDGFGIYSYNTNNPNREEFYFGQWVQGQKQGKGLYLWKHLNKSESTLSSSFYNAVIGNFDNDLFQSGLYIEKNLNEKDNTITYRIYEGAYDKDWKKNGKDCILIENDQVFYGEFVEDKMTRGVITTINKSSNEIENSFCFETIRENETDKYNFIHQKEAKKDNEKRGLDIMAKANELQAFKAIEDFHELSLSLEANFSIIDKFQVSSFDPILSSLVQYLKNTFTLRD